MSTSAPTPPAGYKIEQVMENVPNFLKPLVSSTSVDVHPDDPNYAAEVKLTSPHTIQAYGEDQFTQPVATHEMTHIFDNSRNMHVQAQNLMDTLEGKVSNDNYDYGGMEGLIQAQQQHKTIADFGPEQRANMVADYQELTKEAIDKGDAKLLDQANAAYAPFIKQEASLPSKNESATTMTQKDLTPPEPGLPPAEETGILAENKLMGSDEKVLKNPPKLPKGYHLEAPQ